MSDQFSMDRRRFLGLSAGAALLLTAAGEIIAAPEGSGSPATTPGAAPAAAPKPNPGPPVKCAVIGLGVQGRAILEGLKKEGAAPVAAVCDNYAGAFNRARALAPQAATLEDYRRVLDLPDVQAVFVATPTHLHKQIVLDAVSAGKAVYCEAPIAHTVEDAREIALAGKGSKNVFQVGLVQRADPLAQQVIKFIDADAVGTLVQARAQYNKRNSWRRAASTPEREKALNWRLSKAISTGIAGEAGIHQIDLISWFAKTLPVSVTGYGSIIGWPDGRDTPDTVQALIEYPKGMYLNFAGTLVSSFDNVNETLMGVNSAIFMRGGRGWMVKEADSPALGWEVYARKEPAQGETGIALVANATKILDMGAKPSATAAPAVTEDEYTHQSVADFVMAVRKKTKPAAGWKEGFESTVSAIKVNEAIVSGTKITFQKNWFEL